MYMYSWIWHMMCVFRKMLLVLSRVASAAVLSAERNAWNFFFGWREPRRISIFCDRRLICNIRANTLLFWNLFGLKSTYERQFRILNLIEIATYWVGVIRWRLCGTGCPNANHVLRLPALNLCDQLCVTITRLRKIAILATLTYDRFKKRTFKSGSRLNIIWQKRASGACSKWLPGLAVNVRLNKVSGGTNPFFAAAFTQICVKLIVGLLQTRL